MRRRRAWLLAGLGVIAGALCHGTAGAQDTTRAPRRDTIVRIPIPPQPDTIARRDSAARTDVAPPAKTRADSIQAPLARAELPLLLGGGDAPLVWSRDSLLATGAITLADLLERVPGLTTLRTAWLGLPSVGAYLGDVTRVRIFLDGLELDPEEPRGGHAFDLSRIPLWSLDEVRIARSASEVRVHARSWQVVRTTPYSRVDIATGDQDTDLFRFFFGRRFGNGLAVQAAVDQFSTTPDRVGATNSQTSILTRLGWARGDWQADAFLLRETPRRGLLLSTTGASEIPPLDLTRTESYLRAGYGSVEGPSWAQLLVGGLGYHYTGIRDPAADTVIVTVDPVTGDTTLTEIPADTSRFQAQYALTAGVTRGILRVSATHRMRVLAGRAYQTPSARVSAALGAFAASASVEGRGIDSIARADAAAEFAPVPFLRLSGHVSARNDGRAGGTEGLDWRVESALRAAGLWFGGGIMARDAALLRAPGTFARPYVPVTEPAATGAFATIRGPVWGLVQVDLLGESWQDARGAYRPQYSTRADVFIRSNFLGRFPTGNFGLYALMRHEYRSGTYFPTASGFEQAAGHRILTGLLEIRILDATVTYQFRNLVGTRFELVPGYQMPRQAQFYGVRWTFWN